jgi:hypothetical protein
MSNAAAPSKQLTRSPDLAAAIVAVLDDPTLDALAYLLAPKPQRRLKPVTDADDGWLAQMR